MLSMSAQGNRYNTVVRRALTCAVLIFSAACRDLSNEQTLGDAAPPSQVQNAAGAYGMAISAQMQWQQALARYIIHSGVLTDELEASARGSLENSLTASELLLLDARILTTRVSNSLYGELHAVRGGARQAIGALSKYAGDSSDARRGALYTMIGYAELYLADIFCSGVPLSTWDFEGDYTYRPGSTTAEVYQHAIALFDTALTLAADSLPVMYWATVGKSRAMLAMGDATAAGALVQSVPLDFAQTESLYTCSRIAAYCQGVVSVAAAKLDFNDVSVANAEGGDSVITWTDPRTAAQRIGTGPYGASVYFPRKYVRNGISRVTVASGIEAALIRAEAALSMNDVAGWITHLNTLRASSSLTDTMAQLTDPGSASRRDTLFAERARWLFLTGHRQGDLRRRLRQELERVPQDLYPYGTFPGGIRNYGNDFVLSIDITREGRNPLFRGCFDGRA